MSDDGLYGAYARNAFINVLDQQNASLQEWMDSHQRWMAKAKQLEARVIELEAQKEKYLYFLGGALGTAAEEGMRKRALYVYLKTINQSIRARMDSHAAQKLIDFISPNNPDVSNLLNTNLRNERNDGVVERYINGKFLVETDGVLKTPVIKKGYQETINMYKEDKKGSGHSVAPLEPTTPSVGYDFDEQGGREFIKSVQSKVA